MIHDAGRPPRWRSRSTDQCATPTPGTVGYAASTAPDGRGPMRQRVAQAVGCSRAGSSGRLDRRIRNPVTPAASAASCSRRDAVSDNAPSSSATTATTPRLWSASSHTARRSPASAAMHSRRPGSTPARTRPGPYRSNPPPIQATGPGASPRICATNRAGSAAKAVSPPRPVTSCTVPRGRPPPRCRSTCGTPRGQNADRDAPSPRPCSIRAICARRRASRSVRSVPVILPSKRRTYSEQIARGKAEFAARAYLPPPRRTKRR
ncbi:hypothetical protein GDI0676 [Gluconacetobacter diazotrophicus PA1 5]|uniref:Uncharacterized protein n=1 Tax=Gluconacetobacter diazotrophicus (strain ATCC 49037 / DSM 5601 / CCUG 37298 / CIP 103539 / LMG 7603 / PAl5) TaxID=272568 RepID=A9H955_GLUDA|nr:hypothetical protein GDI0676 [Gluconacetobacter diazotrophicus PA1 5]